MDMQEILSGLENLLEDRATPGDPAMGDDFLVNNYEVVIAGSSIRQGVMYITVRANDGTTKHFRLDEV